MRHSICPVTSRPAGSLVKTVLDFLVGACRPPGPDPVLPPGSSQQAWAQATPRLPARVLSPPSSSGPCTCWPLSGRPIFTAIMETRPSSSTAEYVPSGVGACMCKMTASERRYLQHQKAERLSGSTDGTGSVNHGAPMDWNVPSCRRGRGGPVLSSETQRWREQVCQVCGARAVCARERPVCVCLSTEHMPGGAGRCWEE